MLKCAEIRIMKWPLKNFLMETFLTCIKKINDVFSNEASSMPPKIAGREFHRHDLLPISDFPELAISFWIDFFLPIFFFSEMTVLFSYFPLFRFPFPISFPVSCSLVKYQIPGLPSRIISQFGAFSRTTINQSITCKIGVDPNIKRKRLKTRDSECTFETYF